LILHTGLKPDEYAARLETLIQTEKLAAEGRDGFPGQLAVISGSGQLAAMSHNVAHGLTTPFGFAEGWANQSLALAQAAWVQDGANLDERYYEQQIKVVDRQMALAGLRLAKLLNATIGKMTPRILSRSLRSSSVREA
jgi:hypothetical protein